MWPRPADSLSDRSIFCLHSWQEEFTAHYSGYQAWIEAYMGGLVVKDALSTPGFKCPLTFGFLNARHFTALFRRSGSPFNLIATIPTLFFAFSKVSATLSRYTP